MELQNLYSQFQPLLFSIAYRMLGKVSDAEDIVHDVYVQAGEKNIGNVENVKAYLCKMVTNKCIDHLKSAAHKREVYPGPWLPEPLIQDDNNPIVQVMKGEAISFAILMLLENLKPVERAVFILREVLQYDYPEISQMLNRSEVNCRKIFSRVKEKFPMIQEDMKAPNDPETDKIIQNFVWALNEGDMKKIEELVCQDIILYADGGGKVFAALKPVSKRAMVVRFIKNLLSQNDKQQVIVQVVKVNGQTGLLVKGDDDVKTVICFHVKNEQISKIYIVRNPDKLQHVKLYD
ncbi:RNA polymerase sigma-70 factor [Peribacillus sp. SCS-26]|uniref:RNA polymerase sigma-70 factor n=1 Tax=Paraperibacillus marinus TaxID=3115295 RepID=UPI0039069453